MYLSPDIWALLAGENDWKRLSEAQVEVGSFLQALEGTVGGVYDVNILLWDYKSVETMT